MPDPKPVRTLNLKHPEVYRLARELADETGESMTDAVLASVRERLDRVRATRERDVEARLARILELADEMRARAPGGYFASDLDADLYDEAGLPR